MKTATDQEVRDALAAAVDEMGEEYVYSKPSYMEHEPTECLYVHCDPDGEEAAAPGCIVGHVLHRLGVPLDRLSMIEGMSAEGAIINLGSEGVLSMSLWARGVLNGAQMAQDTGTPWGAAVEHGLSKARCYVQESE